MPKICFIQFLATNELIKLDKQQSLFKEFYGSLKDSFTRNELDNINYIFQKLTRQ